MSLSIDHLAVVASSLSEGCDYVRECLGVDIPFGGEHPHMGTHNCLAKLGDDEFLEVIAINPDAPQPARARWFNLDHHGNNQPYLAHWIARTESLSQTRALIDAPVGEPMNCTRGNLTWKLTVPDDGSFAFDGTFPSIIEWPMRPYPGAAMADIGCHLVSLTLAHPNAAALSTALSPHISDERIQILQGDEARLNVAIQTPNGVKHLV